MYKEHCQTEYQEQCSSINDEECKTDYEEECQTIFEQLQCQTKLKKKRDFRGLVSRHLRPPTYVANPYITLISVSR